VPADACCFGVHDGPRHRDLPPAARWGFSCGKADQWGAGGLLHGLPSGHAHRVAREMREAWPDREMGVALKEKINGDMGARFLPQENAQAP